MSIPNEYLCPISMEIMLDPVIGNDGQTYERVAITEWLKTHFQSPITRERMIISDLKPNFALKSLIEQWRYDHKDIQVSDEQKEKLKQQKEQFQEEQKEKKFSVTGIKDDNGAVIEIISKEDELMETILIAIIDISGSMSEPAMDREKEGIAFTRIDLVKHSLKTLATLVNTEIEKTKTSLGLITFSDNASIKMPITLMDQVGLENALKSIDDIGVVGGTNIWDGLRQGLEVANQQILIKPNSNIQLLLLTDGEPTISYLPPLGIAKTLERRLNSLKGKVTISTFGFGYSLDSNLLELIATLGNGSYGFIPDCSMVGTVFINWTAKSLLTQSHHLSIRLPDGSEYPIGDCQQGSSQKLVFSKINVEEVEIIYDHGKTTRLPVIWKNGSTMEEIYVTRLKKELSKIKNIASFESISSFILELKKDILHMDSPSQLLLDIARDIESDDPNEGQIAKAISKKQWWNKWGRNHCIAYYRALVLRQCINFKDKVLQHFASKEFQELQDKGIDIFSNLPAPVILGLGHDFGPSVLLNPGNNAPNPNVSVNVFGMSRLVDIGGGCFTGDSLITMDDGSTLHVKDIQKGDVVWGGYMVKALIKTRVQKEVGMVLFNTGLGITPWHPIKVEEDREWVFPCQVDNVVKLYVEYYYNLVLETGHVVHLNGYYVSTLGHGFKENEVIRHPYFGTEKVIEDLKKKRGWEDGLVELDLATIVRHSESGLVEHF